MPPKEIDMDKIMLSIIIVNYNTGEFLLKCLDSVLNSKLRKNVYEVIISDNHSGDNSLEIAKNKYPQVKIIINKTNLGFGKANNIAISKAKGKYVLFLNPDTVVFDSTLTNMLDFMELHKEAAASTCRVELDSGELDDACHRGYPTPWRAFCHFSGIEKFFPSNRFFNGYHLGYRDLQKVHEIECCSGAFMLVRKNVGDSLNWFDEDYFWYGEDLDFCYRMKSRGGRIYYVPGEKIIHYKGVSSGIKKHTKNISSAGKKIKLTATKARFEVMRIFYKKHYYDKYPKIVRFLVNIGIDLLENIITLKYK